MRQGKQAWVILVWVGLATTLVEGSHKARQDGSAPVTFSESNTTGFPLEDSWRIISLDTSELWEPKTGFGTKEMAYLANNELVQRAHSFGEVDRLRADHLRWRLNTLGMHFYVVDTERFHFTLVTNLFLCHSLPTKGGKPTFRREVRPAMVEFNSDYGDQDVAFGQPLLFTIPGNRERDTNLEVVPLDIDYCFTDIDFNYDLNVQYNLTVFREEGVDHQINLEELKLAIEDVKGNLTEVSDLFEAKFQSSLKQGAFQRADSLLRVQIASMSFPRASSPALDSLGGSAILASNDTMNWNVILQAEKAISKGFSKASSYYSRASTLLEDKLFPDAPNAASDVDIVLACTTALSGVVVEEFVLGHVLHHEAFRNYRSNWRRKFQRALRFLLITAILIADMLPMILLLVNERSVSRWRGAMITAAMGTSRYGDDITPDTTQGYFFAVASIYGEGIATDDRLALVATALALILATNLFIILRKIYRLKDTFLALFKQLKPQADFLHQQIYEEPL